MRIVPDANVLLSAFTYPGLCSSMLERAVRNDVLITSRHLLKEVERHLKSKFASALPDAMPALRRFEEAALLVTPDPVDPDACRDPDDLPVLGTARAGGADYLVTGD